ncbi:uncharacterized protein LOC111712360 [Eurytemora carolleeae]|uniref:uncharacterized protein LOC111712360 n=1 Tax=Eurytemora carolleeae TaxID=1294199 RepID=UPI000C768166|nr:uncharacterized protein LOC111712360 [Eurytemora carolleeae]|eukprot:XP_023342711.1 uncharacterized protein LOC111712360 [Eurytemora affinis]
MTPYSVPALVCLLYCTATVSSAPQMFIWNCPECPYSTKVTNAVIDFSSSSGATGALKVSHIQAEDGQSSLEIRGPMEGLDSSRTEFRVHEDGDCSGLGEILYSETCNNCQTFISIKVLQSKKLLTLGQENDVMGRPVSIYDTRKGSVLGCGMITAETEP